MVFRVVSELFKVGKSWFLSKTRLVVVIFSATPTTWPGSFVRTHERLVSRDDEDLRDPNLRRGVHVEESEYQG